MDETFRALVSRRDLGVADGPAAHSVLISGESGAGKTEAMKICLAYITAVAGSPIDLASDAHDSIGARLMGTSPVMEALGNARTVRNNNSSRFGKYFELQLSESGARLSCSDHLVRHRRNAITPV